LDLIFETTQTDDKDYQALETVREKITQLASSVSKLNEQGMCVCVRWFCFVLLFFHIFSFFFSFSKPNDKSNARIKENCWLGI
jgi:hypothetical protein